MQSLQISHAPGLLNSLEKREHLSHDLDCDHLHVAGHLSQWLVQGHCSYVRLFPVLYTPLSAVMPLININCCYSSYNQIFVARCMDRSNNYFTSHTVKRTKLQTCRCSAKLDTVGKVIWKEPVLEIQQTSQFCVATWALN